MIYQLIGLFFLVFGCAHIFNNLKTVDTSTVRSLQNTFDQKPWLQIFQDIWFFGRTSFTLTTLVLFTAVSWKMGSAAILLFLIIVGIEQIIKTIFKRSRPFDTHQDIRMLQPIKPHDPSFPSGDALRVWYLALILPAALGDSGVFLITGIILAILVSMGRSVMGVHYPSDVIAGIGLGFIGAGTTIWLWHILGLI
jgi:membrane-associated phospholipid phosphatase